MLNKIYGLSCIENQILSLLLEREQDMTSLYYDAAIPLSEIFDFCIRKGGRMERFDRIERIQNVLKKLGIIQIQRKSSDVDAAINAIRYCQDQELILIRCQDWFVRDKLHARGLRDDHYVRVQADRNKFRIINDIPSVILTVSEDEMTTLYAKDFFLLEICRDLDESDINMLWELRRYRPEDYVPIVFSRCDIEGISELGLRLRNLAGIFKTVLYRLDAYYSNFISTKCVIQAIPKAERYHALFEYFNIKGNTPFTRYFEVFHEINQLEIQLMTELKQQLT